MLTFLCEFIFAANMPLYLLPFLSTRNREKPHERLRLTSLAVINALMEVALLTIFSPSHVHFISIFFPS